MLYVLILYLLGLGLLLSIKKWPQKHNRLIRCVIFWGIATLVALRPFNIFTDTMAYKQVFEDIRINDNIGFSLISSYAKLDVEYGFYYLSWAIKHVTQDYRVYFFIIALLQITFFSLYVKEKYDDEYMQRKIYAYTYPFFGLLYMGITIRAGLEIAMMLYAVELLKKRKRIPLAILIMIAAFSFHRMAIVFGLLWIIYRFVPRFNRIVYRTVWGFSGVLLIVHSATLSRMIMTLFKNLVSRTVIYKMYYGYIDMGLDESLWTSKMPLRYVFFWIIGIIIVHGIRKTDFYFKYYKYINIYMTGVLLSALFFFFPGGTRVLDYFFMPIVLILAELAGKERINLFRNRYLENTFPIFYVIVGITIVMRLSA